MNAVFNLPEKPNLCKATWRASSHEMRNEMTQSNRQRMNQSRENDESSL